MPPDRLREIIKSEYGDREPSVQCRVRDRNFMKDIDWMLAQLELYGIYTQTQRQQPWLLPEALEITLDGYFVSQVAGSKQSEIAY